MEKKNYDNAIWDYGEVIRINPNYANAYYSRGFSWLQKGQFDMAILDFDAAIRLNPNDALAYSGRGSAWQNKKNLGNAQKDFDEATRIDPRAFPLQNVAISSSSYLNPVNPRIGSQYSLCVTVANNSGVERPITVFLTSWPNRDTPVGPTSVVLQVPANGWRTYNFSIYCGANGPGNVFWAVK